MKNMHYAVIIICCFITLYADAANNELGYDSPGLAAFNRQFGLRINVPVSRSSDSEQSDTEQPDTTPSIRSSKPITTPLKSILKKPTLYTRHSKSVRFELTYEQRRREQQQIQQEREKRCNNLPADLEQEIARQLENFQSASPPQRSKILIDSIAEPYPNEQTHIKKIQSFMKMGVKVDGIYQGMTMLQHAIKHNNVVITKLLLDNHANVNQQPLGTKSCLALACIEGNTEIVQMLLDANPHFWPNYLQNTPLQEIARHIKNQPPQIQNNYLSCATLIMNKFAKERLLYSQRPFLCSASRVAFYTIVHGSSCNLTDAQKTLQKLIQSSIGKAKRTRRWWQCFSYCY